jgi:hypothetical protein
MQNTHNFDFEIFPAFNGEGTGLPQGQCWSTNETAYLGTSEWIMVTNDDMYYAPNWDDNIDFTKSLCWSPNLVEPLEQGSAPPFRKLDGGFNLESFRQLDVDDFVAKTKESPAWETGFNLPFFIRRDVWETIGGYDAMYDPWGSNSDSDLQTKVELAGIQPMRNRNVLVYHFSNKSGTFDGTKQEYWQRNWDYYIYKWGFDRKDSPDIWYAKEIVDWDKLLWHPDWVNKYKDVK